MGHDFKALFRVYLREDERGVITMLMLVLFIFVLLLTGVSLDLARHESERADLQSAMDRGVLNAASLRLSSTTDEDIKAAIERYVDTRTFAGATATVKLGEIKTLPEARIIEATASFDMPTAFMSFAGVGSLDVAAASRAIERDPNIELSLLLDRSGSMNSPTKIGTLRSEAQVFIDKVVGANAEDKVSVNLISYSSYVDSGPWMFQKVTDATLVASEGACMTTDYTRDLRTDAGQLPDDSSSSFTRSQVFDYTCPAGDYESQYLSGDATTLKSKISDLKAAGTTSTYIAMDWAMAMLNPDSRPVVDEMITDDVVDPAFTGRPANWDDPNTDKYIVLFTDGKLNNFSHDKSMSWVKETFEQQCEWAKDSTRGIVIFTIAFEAPFEAEEQMKACASDPAFYYQANSDSLAGVFNKIARNIQALKLTNLSGSGS